MEDVKFTPFEKEYPAFSAKPTKELMEKWGMQLMSLQNFKYDQYLE